MFPLLTQNEFLNLELDQDVKEISHVIVNIAEDSCINVTYKFQFLKKHNRFVVIVCFLDAAVEIDIGILEILKVTDEIKEKKIKSLFKKATRDLGENLFFVE